MEWLCRRTNNEIEIFQLKGKYKLLEKPFCEICGNPNTTTDNCVWHKELYGFKRIYVMGKYFQVSRGSVDLLSSHILKFKTDKQYAAPLGMALAFTVETFYPKLLNSHLLVPVPLHLEEFKQRGYNQALELAEVVGKQLDIPVLHALEKTKSLNMKPLSRSERREAVKGLYKVIEYRMHDIKGKSIILIDDVVTTGFSVSECSEILMKSGAAEVSVLALARTVI